MMLSALFLGIASCLAAFTCAAPEADADVQGRYVACQPIGSDCSACGYGYEFCGGSICYNPEAGETCCQSSWSCPGQSACGTTASLCTPTLVATEGEPSPITSSSVASFSSPPVSTISLTTSLTGTTTLTLLNSPAGGAGDTASYVVPTAPTSGPGYSTAAAESTPSCGHSSSETSPPAPSNPPSAILTPSLSSSSTPGSCASSWPLENTTSPGPAAASGTPFNVTATPTIQPPATQPGIPTTGNSVLPISTSITNPIAPSATSTTASPPPAAAQAAAKGKVSKFAMLAAMLLFAVAS